jgi:hypothetical protein
MDTEILAVAIKARHKIQDLWDPAKFKLPRNKLYAKTRGLVQADRLELAVVEPTKANWSRV